MNSNRWRAFRQNDDRIPETGYEAAVFLQNARLHLLGYGYEAIEARRILLDAHDRVNNGLFGTTRTLSREVTA